MMAVLKSDRVIRHTRRLLSRINFVQTPRERRNVEQQAVQVSNTRMFLAGFMVQLYPANIFGEGGAMKEEIAEVKKATKHIISCFKGLIRQVDQHGVIYGMEGEFSTLLPYHLQMFKIWKAADEAQIVKTFTKYLREWDIEDEDPIQTEAQRLELHQKISTAQNRILLIAGKEHLNTVHTELKALKTERLLRSKSAAVISKAWRNHNSSRSLHRMTIANILNPTEPNQLSITNLIDPEWYPEQEFGDQLLELRVRVQSLFASCTMPSKILDETQEFSNHMLHSNLQKSQCIQYWQAYQQYIDKVHILIDKLSKRQYTGTGIPQESKPIPEDSMWAEMNTDIRPRSSKDQKIMDAYFAKAIIKDLAYKALELIFTPHRPSEVSIFDLGKTYPQFRNCKLIACNQINEFSSALVQTQFAPQLLLIRSSSDAEIFFVPTNNTVYIACFKDKIVVPDISVAIVEIKHCAFCSKPAKNKCSTCWRNSRVCVRYCSKDCTTKDRRRHSAVCGRDLSDEWKSAK
jgi:hypothetical protein